MEVMHQADIYPSSAKIARFFLGSRGFKNESVTRNKLFGKFRGRFTYDTLKPFVEQLLLENPHLKRSYKSSSGLPSQEKEVKPWAQIDYFQREYFCQLTDKAINQLKDRITGLGIIKIPETLSEAIIQIRIKHPRAYEPWSEKEIEYFCRALRYTNNLEILSVCFQRGQSALESLGKKLIFKGMAEVEKTDLG
jgi:hypothetical protein